MAMRMFASTPIIIRAGLLCDSPGARWEPFSNPPAALAYTQVLEDQVKIFIRKWAKTGWFKLTNLDGR